MPERAPKQLAEPKFLEPFSTCRSCIESLDDLDWVASSTFHVGEWALGVRSSSVETDAAVRAVLAAHLVDIEAPPNFSALMADASGADGHVRAFNFLYRSSDPLVRTRAPGRVLRTLLHYLSDFAEPESSTIRLAATGFVVGDRAIVAPDGIRFEMANVETRLDRAGLQVIDAPVLHLEPESGCIVVPEPALTVDRTALADFERRYPPTGREREPVRPGRYPIAVWAFTTEKEQAEAVSGAQAVAAAAQQVVNADGLGAQHVLDTMAAVVERTAVSGMCWQDPAELAGQLCALAARPSRE
jgi:hypothetical protein